MSVHQFQLRAPPTPTTWQDQLQSATTEADVVHVVKEYVAQFTPEEINRLPEVCRPGKFFDANDITSLAFALVRHHCEDTVGSARLVQKMAPFFSNASIRLSEIMSAANALRPDSKQSA